MRLIAVASSTVFCTTGIGWFVGTLMGISNTVATLPGFIGPAVVGVLTYNNVSFVNVDVSVKRVKLELPSVRQWLRLWTVT